MPTTVCQRTGGDKVDSDRRECEREAGGEGRERSGDCRHHPHSDAWAAATGAAQEQERASGSYLVCRVACDLEHLQEVAVEGEARLLEVHVEKVPVVRLAGRHHHVVDRARQVSEESLDRSRIVGVEGRCAHRFELAGGALEAFGIAGGEDQPSSLSACSSGRFESNASATADYNDSLPEKFWFAPDGRGDGCGAHIPPRRRVFPIQYSS
jgi:hypothetical protein